jgi:hypothetical protein
VDDLACHRHVIDDREVDPLDVSDHRDAHAPDRSGAQRRGAARSPTNR